MGHPVTAKTLLVLVGATAVGKTEVAIELAMKYQCPILSADSRQCYKELGIATAKPSAAQLSKVTHYFINTHSIHHPASAADFEDYALATLNEIYQQNDFCVLAGGSGLYIKAVCEGLDDIPEIQESIRRRLVQNAQKHGLKPLIAQLQELDPVAASMIDHANTHRVIRALEVCLGTGQPFSSFRKGVRHSRPFKVIKIGMHRDRKMLYSRINQRVDQMIEQGIFQEAAGLYHLRDKKPLQTVGYQEVFGYMDQQYDREEAIRLLKRNTRRYAKRQLTWFGKDPEIQWFPADNSGAIFDFLDQTIPGIQKNL